MVFSSALLYGLALSVSLTILMIISGTLALDMWVGDYPPDIREKYGPMSPGARRLRPFFATAIFAVVLVILFLGLFDLRTRLGVAAWIPALAFGVLTLLVFNVFDLLVLDWLFFCTV